MNLFKEIFRDITTLGGFVFTSLLCLTLLVVEQYGLFFKTVVGLVLILLICIIIRLLYYKDRPRKQPHHNLIERIDASSFPSMHTARAFFLPIIFWHITPQVSFKIVLILLTITVTYSRIYLQKHDWIDVSAGAILGTIVGIGIIYF